MSCSIPLIAAGSGLLGVIVGSFFTTLNQRRERQQRYAREQLSEFYGPMLALRALIAAQTAFHARISGAADATWRNLTESAGRDIDDVRRVRQDCWPQFEKILKENDRQFVEEIMPAFRRMHELFTSKIHLVQASTREHFAAFTEFVEIWKRWLAGSIPGEVAEKLHHSEATIRPLYQDLSANFERLQRTQSE